MSNPGPLVDIGANLTHDSFDEDRELVIQRAQAAGVTRFVITGSSGQGSRDALALADNHPATMYSTAGVHPHHASEYSDEVHDGLAALLEDPRVVAVGECGLDYFRNFSPADAQRDAFRRQLDLAEQFRKPLFLHQRDAHSDFVDLLAPRIERLPAGVAHCFTGDTSMLQDYLDLGLYIGITGWICDERRGAHLQALIADIPEDRLMIETDAPYLLPRTLRPRPKTRRNEPVYLREVLRVVARAAGKSETELARSTTANAERFFGLAPAGNQAAES